MNHEAQEDLRGNIVPSSHRVIRALPESESPINGLLVAFRHTVAVSVPATSLDNWTAWKHAGAEHVFAPVDVVRRRDGHDVLVPWCIERVDAFVRNRQIADDALSAGESTTLALSMLRGIAEAERNVDGPDRFGVSADTRHPGTGPEDVAGSWWLTHDGRPMLVLNADASSARHGAREILTELRRGNADRPLVRIFEGIQRGLERKRFGPGEVDEWERELLELAAPRALRRDEHSGAIETSQASAVNALRAQSPARQRGVHGRLGSPRRSTLMRIRRLLHLGEGRRAVIAVIQAESRSAFDRMAAWRPRRRTRSTAGQQSPKRRLVVVAGIAASVVLGAGLIWPASAEDNTEAKTPQMGATNEGAPDNDSSSSMAAPPDASPRAGIDASAAGTRDSAPEPVPHTDGAKGSGDQILEDAGSVIADLAMCAQDGDSVCTAALAPGALFPDPGLVTAGRAAPVLSLVDDYGDVVVLRARPSEPDPADGDAMAEQAGSALPEQILVLVRLNDLWLVRDVYDVANQPE